MVVTLITESWVLGYFSEDAGLTLRSCTDAELHFMTGKIRSQNGRPGNIILRRPDISLLWRGSQGNKDWL